MLMIARNACLLLWPANHRKPIRGGQTHPICVKINVWLDTRARLLSWHSKCASIWERTGWDFTRALFIQFLTDCSNSKLAVKCPFSLCIWIMIVYIMYIYSKKPKPNVGRSAHGYMQPQIMQWFSTSGPGTTSGPWGGSRHRVRFQVVPS